LRESYFCTNLGETQEDQEAGEDNMTERERVTDQDARVFTAGVLLHFMQEGNEGNHIPALKTWLEFVQFQAIERTWQVTLDQFLEHFSKLQQVFLLI
jgi:hypothetical protein